MNSIEVQQPLPPSLENYKKASISVWWDMSGCRIPRGNDPHRVVLLVSNIKSSLEQLDYKGDVTIYAYEDFVRWKKVDFDALGKNGIRLNYVPSGGKDTISKKLMVDTLVWVKENQRPANIMLISKDRELSDVLHQLKMRKYNILLALPKINKSSLVVAANTIWQWNKLRRGEPPDVANLITYVSLPGSGDRKYFPEGNQAFVSFFSWFKYWNVGVKGFEL